MGGEDWKNKSRPLNGHCTQISSVLYIPCVVIADCVTAEKICTNGQYSTTSQSYNHTKAMSPSTAAFMISKAVRPVESTRHHTCHWSVPSWWAQGSEPDSFTEAKLKRSSFMEKDGWTAKITAQVHHVEHKFAMEREAWRQLVELHEPVWKNQ